MWKWLTAFLAGLVIGLSTQWVAYVKDSVTLSEAKAMHQEIARAEDRRHELESKALVLQSARIEEALLEIKDELKFIRSRVR